jgi:hypothetical protein
VLQCSGLHPVVLSLECVTWFLLIDSALPLDRVTARSIEMSVAKKPDKGDALIRTLAAKTSNKSCFNCCKPGTQRSVCLTTGTFICDLCAGRQYVALGVCHLQSSDIHPFCFCYWLLLSRVRRGLPGFLTGTISARTFTEKEAAVFEKMGNKRARKVWYHGFDEEKLRATVAALGDDPKKWQSESALSPAAHRSIDLWPDQAMCGLCRSLE